MPDRRLANDNVEDRLAALEDDMRKRRINEVDAVAGGSVWATLIGDTKAEDTATPLDRNLGPANYHFADFELMTFANSGGWSLATFADVDTPAGTTRKHLIRPPSTGIYLVSAQVQELTPTFAAGAWTDLFLSWALNYRDCGPGWVVGDGENIDGAAVCAPVNVTDLNVGVHIAVMIENGPSLDHDQATEVRDLGGWRIALLRIG